MTKWKCWLSIHQWTFLRWFLTGTIQPYHWTPSIGGIAIEICERCNKRHDVWMDGWE